MALLLWSPDMKRRLAIIAAAAAAFALAKADYEAAGRRWWAHIEYLASDQMKGRQTGSKEYQKGADYVAAQLREIGVQPAGVDGGWWTKNRAWRWWRTGKRSRSGWAWMP